MVEIIFFVALFYLFKSGSGKKLLSKVKPLSWIKKLFLTIWIPIYHGTENFWKIAWSNQEGKILLRVKVCNVVSWALLIIVLISKFLFEL